MVKKILKILAVAFIVIQLYRPERNISTETSKNDFLLVEKSPKDISKLIQTSCYDCHSNNTTYPWYAHIAPVSWMMSHHIEEAKEELNFSEWASFTDKRKKHKLEELIEVIEEGDMPLNNYLWMHSEAKLSTSDKETLIRWFRSLEK